MKILIKYLLSLLMINQLSAFEAGDRHIVHHIKYPSSAFYHEGKGGNVLDITKAPFHAKGDGVTDDTLAFVKALDFILTEQDKVGYSATAMLNTSHVSPNLEGYPIDGPLKVPDSSFIIYIPEGEYLVSDTLIYSMVDRTPTKRQDYFYKRGATRLLNSGWERFIWVRFIGEKRESTIIRLKDHAEGFGAGEEKAVFAFGKSPFNNRKALSCISNLTVNCGRGNPGAVAVDFTGANAAQMNELTLTSEDGEGAVGILMKRPPVIGYHHDISINGFDYGIVSRVGHACAPVFEYISLNNQKKSSILLAEKKELEGGHGEAFMALRKVVSRGATQAAQVTHAGAHLIMTDSEIYGESSEMPAIELRNGELFLRDVLVKGYVASVVDSTSEKELKEETILEYVSNTPFSSSAEAGNGSLRLVNEEAPILSWPSSEDEWATPAEFGAVCDGETDDTAAVQAAFNSGKRVIFLTQPRYHVNGDITVPASVELVVGMFRYNSDLRMVVNEYSDRPVRFMHFYRAEILHDCNRTVVREFSEMQYGNTKNVQGGKMFSLGGSYPKKSKNKGKVTFYGWSINNEGKGLPLIFDDAFVWIFGMKTERGPLLRAYNHSQVEILGATLGVRTGDLENPAVVSDNSNLTLIANKSAGEWDSEQLVVKSIVNGVENALYAHELPQRGLGDPGYCMIPLYTSRVSKVDADLDVAVVPSEQLGDSEAE